MIVVLSARDAWLAAALRLQHIEPLLRERAQPRLTCGAMRRVNVFAPSTHTTLAPRAGVPCVLSFPQRPGVARCCAKYGGRFCEENCERV